MSDSQDPNEHRLKAIDQAVLTSLLCKSSGSQTMTVTNWSHEPVSGGTGDGMGSTSLYRFVGQGEDQSANVAWSLIVKILQARPEEDASAPHYWKREAEIFRSGLLNDLPGDFRAPRCFDVVEYHNEACWIWEEDVQDELGKVWPLQHYQVIARHLGQFNGAYLVERALPSAPWLSANWFRKTAVQNGSRMADVYPALSSPLLKRDFPSDASEQLSRLVADRELFLDALDRLPQTFCHMDAFRRNLMARHIAHSRFETVAVDWTYSGIAAIGTDIAVTLLVNLLMFEVDATDAPELDSLLFNSYLDGLRGAGWGGAEKTVRLGFAMTVVAKYFELVTVLPFLAAPDQAAAVEHYTGHSVEDNARQAAGMFRLTQQLAAEARAMLATSDRDFA